MASKKNTKAIRRAYGSLCLHVGDTKRLRIFAVSIKPTPFHSTKRIVFAFRTTDDTPKVVATAVFDPDATPYPYLEWIEVASDMRRQGYGREMREFLVAKYGELDSCAGSQEGAAFRAALGLDEPEEVAGWLASPQAVAPQEEE